MKKLFILLFVFTGLVALSVTSTTKNQSTFTCPKCESSISEMEAYIRKLETTIKALHDDVARWMKLYSDEISSKANALEKSISYYVDSAAKMMQLELRMNSALGTQKKCQ